MTGTDRAILAVEKLDAAYGRAQILFDVSLKVRRGEIVALMGRNGAGKSTTLKAIMGLVAARAEAISFSGHSILGLAPYRIARLGLGYVPEDRRIFTDLTVLENLEVGTKPAAGNGREAWTPDRLFSIFPNLAEMPDRRASQMSGGEQQMLTIARTLMGNPDAVLLDEPSEGLAPVIVEQMIDAVHRMKAEAISVVLAEQNLTFAAAVADRFYIIEKGAIQYEGRMSEIEKNPILRETYLAA
jgi:branched-chain amino acid transport system ATP-binding protein